jgi:hypothetical protein
VPARSRLSANAHSLPLSCLATMGLMSIFKKKDKPEGSVRLLSHPLSSRSHPLMDVRAQSPSPSEPAQTAQAGQLCFFDIVIDSVPAGRLVFSLYDEQVPKTVRLFFSFDRLLASYVSLRCPSYLRDLIQLTSLSSPLRPSRLETFASWQVQAADSLRHPIEAMHAC